MIRIPTSRNVSIATYNKEVIVVPVALRHRSFISFITGGHIFQNLAGVLGNFHVNSKCWMRY